LAGTTAFGHNDPMIARRRTMWLLSAGLWSLYGAMSGTQIWLSMLSHHHSLVRILVYQVLVWQLWIVFSWLVHRLVRLVPPLPPRPLPILLHLGVGLVLGTLHALWWVALVLWIVPYDWMNPSGFLDAFIQIGLKQMPLELVLYGLVVLADYALDYYGKYREREVRTAQLERSLAEARLQALELQLQPHFLFNTLNGISALVRGGQDTEAIGMISGLSDLLRYALDRAGGPRVALEEEAAMLGRYLEIQRLRFADRLTYTIDVADDARGAAVPVLLLQPLAENAIRHGIARSDAPGRVSVAAARDGDMLRISVFNTGRVAEGAEHGIGLATTVARLAQLYGEGRWFELAPCDGGVLATVTLPWSVAK
jgi:hypothetical protein